MTARAAVRALAALLPLAACGAPGFPDYAEEAGRYDRLSAVELDVLVRARALAEQGRLEEARRAVATLCAAQPENLVAARFLQDVELALLAEGAPVPGVDPDAARADPLAALHAREAALADEDPSAAACVRAARVAPDARTAELWLARALEADPACVWAHYGLAWNHARLRRFEEAWDALERALDLDEGHPQARRLEASLLQRGGEVERAIDAWRAWIARYGNDPRTAPADDAAAHLDLAALLVQAGEPEEALAALDSIEPRLLARPAGAALVRAAALEGLDRPQAALAEARRAAELAPDDPMPRVQIAILLSDRFGDEAGARAAWEEVLRLTGAASGRADAAAPHGEDPAAAELSDLILRLQARAALAKLPPAEPGPKPR